MSWDYGDFDASFALNTCAWAVQQAYFEYDVLNGATTPYGYPSFSSFIQNPPEVDGMATAAPYAIYQKGPLLTNSFFGWVLIWNNGANVMFVLRGTEGTRSGSRTRSEIRPFRRVSTRSRPRRRR